MSAPDLLPEWFEDDDLFVRRWTVDDAPALHEAINANIEHLRPWMPWIAFEPQTVEQRVALIEQWEKDWRAGGDVVLGVLLDGVVVGSTGLHRRIGPDGLEIGYWIDHSHVGRCLAPRVSAVLTTAAFTLPEITHVEISCDQANTASARVAQKLGFTYIGNIDAPIVAPSEIGSHRVYRMTRSTWAGSKVTADREPMA
ncbi:MAG: GNAT family N-acetyltransferase [Actinobacteria bacterium]|nr:GNAT family N-acetyltransferase [Actinomycetota bacterium]